VDRALAQAPEHARLTEHNPFNGSVVGEHRDDGIALASVGQSSSFVRPPIDQPLRLARRAIVDATSSRTRSRLPAIAVPI
jgi:hypothetical protein